MSRKNAPRRCAFRVATDPSVHAIKGMDQCGRGQLAFPDDRCSPSEVANRRHVAFVAFDVASELLRPELRPGLRDGGIPAAGMAMPEATMNEDGATMPRQNQIGPPRQAAVMQDVSETQAMQSLPQGQLRLGVLPPDPRHHARAGLGVNDVDHPSALWHFGSILIYSAESSQADKAPWADSASSTCSPVPVDWRKVSLPFWMTPETGSSRSRCPPRKTERLGAHCCCEPSQGSFSTASFQNSIMTSIATLRMRARGRLRSKRNCMICSGISRNKRHVRSAKLRT